MEYHDLDQIKQDLKLIQSYFNASVSDPQKKLIMIGKLNFDAILNIAKIYIEQTTLNIKGNDNLQAFYDNQIQKVDKELLMWKIKYNKLVQEKVDEHHYLLDKLNRENEIANQESSIWEAKYNNLMQEVVHIKNQLNEQMKINSQQMIYRSIK